jgi:hypothetical protein
MGRCRRKTGEPKTKMEGSGEDNEPQVLAGIERR